MILENTFFNRLKRKFSKRESNDSSKKISMGIIGAGNVAFWKYVPAILDTPAIQFQGAYDANIMASEKLCRAIGGKAYSSAELLITDPEIEAICICTPPDTHFDLLKMAIASKKHILCEKPMTSSLEESKQIVALAHSIGMVNYSFRFRPEWILIKEILSSGLIGNVHNVIGQISQGGWFDASYSPSKERNDAADWRYHPGGGVINELGSHMIDLSLWLFGDIKDASIKKATFGIQDNPSEDISAFLIEFINGALGQLEVSRLATGYKEYSHLEIFGQKGTIKNDNGRIFLWLRSEPRFKELLVPKVSSNQFLQTFVDAINHQKTDYPTFEEGYKVRSILQQQSF